MANEPLGDGAMLKAREQQANSAPQKGTARGTWMLAIFLLLCCVGVGLTYYNLPTKKSGSGVPATPLPHAP